MRLDFARFLNLVQFWATDGASQEDVDKFEARLNRPDPKRAKRLSQRLAETAWSRESEQSALSGLAAALTGGGG